jgi:hypothetical protein
MDHRIARRGGSTPSPTSGNSAQRDDSQTTTVDGASTVNSTATTASAPATVAPVQRIEIMFPNFPPGPGGQPQQPALAGGAQRRPEALINKTKIRDILDTLDLEAVDNSLDLTEPGSAPFLYSSLYPLFRRCNIRNTLDLYLLKADLSIDGKPPAAAVHENLLKHRKEDEPLPTYMDVVHILHKSGMYGNI